MRIRALLLQLETTIVGGAQANHDILRVPRRLLDVSHDGKNTPQLLTDSRFLFKLSRKATDREMCHLEAAPYI